MTKQKSVKERRIKSENQDNTHTTPEKIARKTSKTKTHTDSLGVSLVITTVKEKASPDQDSQAKHFLLPILQNQKPTLQDFVFHCCGRTA